MDRVEAAADWDPSSMDSTAQHSVIIPHSKLIDPHSTTDLVGLASILDLARHLRLHPRQNHHLRSSEHSQIGVSAPLSAPPQFCR